MTDMIEKTLNGLGGRVSLPGDERYAAATSIWAKPATRMPHAVVHCRTSEDVQLAVHAARNCNLPLSVRGGGHDWAGRALCEGIVIDLSAMNSVVVCADKRTARVSGGARARDVAAVTDPLRVAPVTGSVGSVGMAGLTLGGGYGPLIGRFGLALDSLTATAVVLADGRAVVATADCEEDLFWALRGGGGNFGVVVAMHLRLHDLPSVRSGMLFYPFAEAKSVLEGFVDIASSAPAELTAQLGFVGSSDGPPVMMIVPTWCGLPEQGEAHLAPFFKLGSVLMSNVEVRSYGASLSLFDPYLANGQRVFMDSCCIPALNRDNSDIFIDVMETAVSPGCAIFTHEFRGAATQVPVEATAFGLRRSHVLVELLAAFIDRSDKLEEEQHQRWIQTTLHRFDPTMLPAGYPNLLPKGDVARAVKSYGGNAERLLKVKRHYDHDNVFSSAIPLPVDDGGRQRRETGVSLSPNLAFSD